MTAPRRDVAVIMARGSGRRMGGPKQGLRLPGISRTFLEMIADLYRPRDWPLLLVTGPMGPDAGKAGSSPADLRTVRGPAGGDTALTLALARAAMAADGESATHWWAHPVDLPLVTAGVLEALAGASGDHPAAVIRPCWEGRPGHPVVLPDGVLDRVASDPDVDRRPLRDLLAAAEIPIRSVAAADPGVVHDFDAPGDLDRWRPEGAP